MSPAGWYFIPTFLKESQMQKRFRLILLTIFAILFGHPVSAQTSTAPPPEPPQFTEIQLGETWPDTPLFAALRSEVEKVWIQKGESWFTREENGVIQQIDQINVGITHYGGKSVHPEDRDGEISLSFGWKRERFYIPSLGQWTPWQGDSQVHFSFAIREGRVTPGKIRVHYSTMYSKVKRTISTRPELDEVKTALSSPEMTEAEFKALDSHRPRIISLPQPEYSPEGRAAQIRGKVVLSVAVNADGSVGRVSVTKSLGYGLDEKAIETARKGKFAPATRLGSPVGAALRVEISFNLPEQEIK
jgi:TonB family protein